MKKLIIAIAAICFVYSLPLAAQNDDNEDLFSLPEDFDIPNDVSDEITEEKFGLYGYLVNLLNVNINMNGDRFDNADFGDTVYLRLKGDWNPGEHLSFHAELSYIAQFGNQNPMVFFESAGLPPLVPQENFPLDDFVQSLTVDHFYGTVSFRQCDIRFGKMPIAWGTGYAFNPTQKTSLSPFMDTVSEETPGTYGISPGVSITDRLAIQGYVAFQDKTHKLNAVTGDADWDNLPYGIKIKGIIGAFDLSAGWIKEVIALPNPLPPPLIEEYRRSYYIGADFAGAVWDFGVYGEAAFLLPQNPDREFDFEGYDFEDLIEVACGFDYTIPVIDVDARCEYYHQGSGTADKDDYDATKILSGEQVLQAEDYLFFFLEKTFLDYYSISTAGFVNLNDGSLAIVPSFAYDMYGNFQVECGGMIFFGPDGSEFNGEYTVDYGVPIDIDLIQPGFYLRAKLSF
ncbi:MAG: hypothetical protein JW881_03590 [Spirochaetales bacterium]|nr:hypothetical protein [Spirochaetales bacterium]